MSVLELAEQVCTTQNIAALGRVAQLHAIEREMLLGQLKRKALLRLAELTDEVPAANADEIRAAEVMRKACADLLRSGGSNTEKRSSRPGGPGSRGYHQESITPASEAEVLAALERLGEEINEYEHRAQASGSVVPTSPEITPSSEIQSRFNSQPGEESGADASGSLRKCTGKMPMPPLVEATRHGCSGQVPPARADCGVGSLSPIPHGQATRRTSRMPLPLYIRSTRNRITNNSTRTLPEDAHPP